MPSPEIKVDRDVVLTINHQEFRVRKGERFIVGEGKVVIKPCRERVDETEGDEVNENNSVDQDLDSVNQDKNSGNQSQVHPSGEDELSPRPALEAL